MFSRCGRIWRLASRRSLGTRAVSAAPIPVAMMTARMIQTAVELLPEPDEAWKALAANGIEMRTAGP